MWAVSHSSLSLPFARTSTCWQQNTHSLHLTLAHTRPQAHRLLRDRARSCARWCARWHRGRAAWAGVTSRKCSCTQLPASSGGPSPPAQRDTAALPPALRAFSLTQGRGEHFSSRTLPSPRVCSTHSLRTLVKCCCVPRDLLARSVLLSVGIEAGHWRCVL